MPLGTTANWLCSCLPVFMLRCTTFTVLNLAFARYYSYFQTMNVQRTESNYFCKYVTTLLRKYAQ